MTTVPLGQNAFKRLAAGEPEIYLQNRYVEKAPTNLREHTTLLARSGTNSIAQCTGGIVRGLFSKNGLFNTDLFVVSGHNLWRINSLTGLVTQITGTVANFGFPYVTWMKGIGYEYLFISDGSTLQYFSEHASGTWTLTGNIQEGMVLKIGATYIGWSATVDHGSPAGTVSNPYWALLANDQTSTALNNTQSLANMAAALNYAGDGPGLSFSSAIPGPNADVSATSADVTLVVTSVLNTTAGNAIATTTPVDGGGSGAWAHTTLTGGGGAALQAVTGFGSGEAAKALATVSGYVLVSVGNSQKFYWLNPGEVVINPLNFAEKESNPDNILDMTTAGDQVFITGNGSTEVWYATGDFSAPFAPVEGRVYQRGVVEGTLVVVGDSVIFVGEDSRVYQIGITYGGEAQYGVHRISDNGIEERIRTQLRRERGLPP